MPYLNVDLGYSYNNSKVVFKDVSLKTFKDEIVAIVGPTGTGKSTLIRVLAHLIGPASGYVYLNGHEVNSPSSDISLIHQSIATFPWMNALDNVKVGLRSNKKINSHDANQISIKMLDLVGLEGAKHMYPKEMSGGMRQKIAIARGLASSPSVLLMDEPFVHLDEFSANNLRREIHSIVFNPETSLKSVILISHNLNEVVELADRVYVMREGNNKSSSLSTPATIVDEIKIDIQRPRSPRDPKFYGYVDKLYSNLDIKETV